MKRVKRPNYFNSILMAIFSIAFICFFYITSSIFTMKVGKSNVFINFKEDNKSTYSIFINDSLIITSNEIRKLVPKGFYKQTEFSLPLANGQYRMTIRDSVDNIIADENFEVMNLDERYLYLYINSGEIETKDEPYMLL